MTEITTPAYDPRPPAERLKETPVQDIDAVFLGMVYALSEGGDGSAAERMAKLRGIIEVYKEHTSYNENGGI